MLKMNSHALLLAFSLLSGAALASPPSAQAEDVKVPTTPEEHLALAKGYEEKAVEYTKEAEHHEAMFEAYKASVASSPKSPPPPSVLKMQRHCKVLAKDAEKLAADAKKAAEYHTLRAKELQGK